MEKIKILYLLSCPMKYGGTETFIINFYRKLNKDIIQIDFVYQGYEKGVYDDELLENGSNIYHVPYKNQNPILYTKKIKEIIMNGNYKIVHSHMDAMGAWPLLIAKIAGVPIRIAHSHNTSHQTNNKIKLFINDLVKIIIRKVSNYYFACSKEAGIWLFGEKLYNQNKIKIIHNAIELDKYSFSDSKRQDIRSQFNITNQIVIGHVGQFREQKNHKKIIEIFYELLKDNTSYLLMLIGSGPLEDEIKKMVYDLGIQKNVIFVGESRNIFDLLNVFDIFLFPSLFEGLGIVAIEAQANGLPCVFSNQIPQEAIINKNVYIVGLDEDVDCWINALKKAYQSGHNKNLYFLRQAGYDINKETNRLQEIYIDLYNSYERNEIN